ncbi:hypothetical protein GUJ11_09510 [Enterococcus hirae]|uniref:hypothetical protein n=1 Tax=Enterococcus hirae TaxID=1354 RepID=UPI00136B00BD|nr:hypothetical protein [Enterococcus hirae]NAB82980.1 hypothetical protein [Enterococcus hirae]NAD50795.1 hypothetical protein [Enterococcus hirae]
MNYLVRKNILENETGEWQNKSNLKSEFIKEASSFSVKKENVFTLCEKPIQENNGEKTALLKVQDMLDDFKFEVLRRMAGDRKVFELQSEKTEYEARIEHAEGKISGEQLQQKINVLEKEQETKIVKHERYKATIEKLETKDVFLSNNSHESNDYLGAIAIDEKKKYFENKDLAEILASQISQSKQKLTGFKQHKRNEVADCNKKLNELNNVSQKNQKMIQETLNKSNTPNTLDKVRGQTITDAVIVDKIKKLVKEFMRTENFEIIKTDTLEEMYAKATAVDIMREEVENRKDKAKKVLVETATIRRKKRQDRGSVLEQNQDQMNVSERVVAFEKNGESKPDQTVSVKTPNKNGSNLPNGNKQQTNNSFNRSEVDLRDQVKPEPESINRLSNSNLSKENEQQTNHSLDESEVGLRKQAKPEIQATNSLPNGASEKDSANNRPVSGDVQSIINQFNSNKETSPELQKGPRITFAQGHSQQEVSKPNGNKQQTNHSLDESEVVLRDQAKPETKSINRLSNVSEIVSTFEKNGESKPDQTVSVKTPNKNGSNLPQGNKQQTNNSFNRSEDDLRKQAKPEIQATNSLANSVSEKDSANDRPVPGHVKNLINKFNIEEKDSLVLRKGPKANFIHGLSQQEERRSNRIARSRSVSHTLHEVHREQTDKGRRNSAPELTTPSESPLRSKDRETSSPMYDDSLHERHLKLSDFELDPEKKPFDDTQFDKFQRFEYDIPLRYIGKLRNLTNSERVLSSLSTTQDLKTHDKLVRRNSAPGVMTEQSIPSHSFDQFDRILIPRVKLRYVNGQVSLSKEITNQTAELNKFPELSSFTNQVLTPGDSLDQPSTPNSDSEINNLTNQVPLPKDSSDLRSVSEGDMNQTSMPENVNSTLDETDSVKKSVSVEDLKLAYVERLRSQVAFVEQKIKHDEELKKYGPYNNFFLDQSKKSKAARSKIEIDLTKNKTLCEGLKTILGDEKKLAEFLEEIQPKDPQVLAKELENVKQDTAELKGKAEELKEITYKDLKKKWYQVLTRPSFYLFLARQVLWVAPMAFFSAMAGALPLMPTGTQILHGSAVVNWLRGVIIGSYVGQRLVNAVPKIIPRTSKRVQRFAKERFPKTVAALEKGSKTIARPFKSIGKSVRSTARTIGRPLKPVGKVVARPYKFGKEKLSNLNAKTFVPIGKKIKETFDIAHSEKRSSEENQNLKKGLDANGQRLPFATRVKNAALMTTTNFAKRLWRNKVKTLIGVALFVGLATFGLPLLLTAALPAISGTLIASVAAIAVPALFTLLGVWVADKYLLKPLQNRLANRENAKREQLFTERSAKVQELGQHHSLTPDFNTRVARVAQIDNEKQTAEKQKTQTSQKTQEQESARTSISSISTLNKQTETDKVRLRDSVSRVLNNPTNAKQSSGRASVSSKNDHQRSEGYGR